MKIPFKPILAWKISKFFFQLKSPVYILKSNEKEKRIPSTKSQKYLISHLKQVRLFTHEASTSEEWINFHFEQTSVERDSSVKVQSMTSPLVTNCCLWNERTTEELIHSYQSFIRFFRHLYFVSSYEMPQNAWSLANVLSYVCFQSLSIMTAMMMFGDKRDMIRVYTNPLFRLR